jgi:hypothetical protein
MATCRDIANHGRIYWTRVEVCDKADKGERGFTTPDSEVLRLIFAIPGVQIIHGAGYKIQIHISEAFSWDDIDPKVRQILDNLELSAGQLSSDESEGQAQ